MTTYTGEMKDIYFILNTSLEKKKSMYYTNLLNNFLLLRRYREPATPPGMLRNWLQTIVPERWSFSIMCVGICNSANMTSKDDISYREVPWGKPDPFLDH